MQTPSFLWPALGAMAVYLPLSGLAQSSEAVDTILPSHSLPMVDAEVTPLDIGVTGPVLLDQRSRTGSLLGISVRETPASMTVIDRKLMEAIGAEDTQSALHAVPGLTAQDSPGSPGLSYRGFSTTSLAQLFNGINVQYSIAARPVDSWIYDRVEVIGGPSGFLYGSGAVGGTINYITKLAQVGDFAEARLRLGSDRLREVSVGLNRRVGSGANAAGPNHYARLDINSRRNHGWTEGTQRQATQLAVSVRTDVGAGLTHTLAYEYQRETVDRPYWGTPLLRPIEGTLRIDAATRRKNYNSEDGFYGQRVQWLRSLSELQVNERLRLSNTLYAYDALRDYRNVESYQFNADNSAVIRSNALLQRHQQRLVGNRIDASFQTEWFGLPSDWAAGLDLSANQQTHFPLSLTGIVNTVDPYDFTTGSFWDVAGMVPIFRPNRTVRLKTSAVLIENRSQLTPHLQLLTGLRHDRIGMALSNHQAVTVNSPAYFKRNYQSSTGRMALMWQLAAGWNAYIQYATAADPPSGNLMTATFVNAATNTDLTTGRQVELGMKNEFWDGKASSTLAVFHITRKNIATQDPDNSSNTLLVGQQSSKGIEWTVGLQPSARFSILGNLAYVNAQYDHFNQNGLSLAGKKPIGMPPWVGNVWGQYQVSSTFSLGAGLRRIDRSYADASNSLRRPAYTLLDLAANWRIRPDMQLSTRLRNATDTLYMRNSASSSAYLGAPRLVDVLLHLKL